MPDKKMDKKAREQYRKTLLKIKEEISHDIRQMASDNSADKKDTQGDVSGHALHMADVASDMYDREFSLGLASNDRELLHKVDMALKRIEQKKFGFCTECHKPIPVIRLKAIPYAETCLKCQEKIEASR